MLTILSRPISTSKRKQFEGSRRRMLPVVPEVLRHGAARIRRQELQGRGVRGRGGHHGGVFQAVLATREAGKIHLSCYFQCISNRYMHA